MNRILVIGGTGNVGRHVVDQLAQRGARFRAMTRNPDTAGFPPQVEVVRGDLTVPETLDRCLEDVETVFLVWVAPPGAAAGALERIATHAKRIVFLTAPLKTPHPFFQQPNPSRDMVERIERLIETSGMQWTFLRAGMFAGNALHFWAPRIRAGDVVRWPYLDAPTAPTDERDLAATAVRVLCEEGHAGAEYVITGPQSLTQAEQVHTIGRAIGRSLQVEEISPDEARSELLPVLGPPPVVNMLLNAWAAALGQPAFVSPTFMELTGAPPRTFLEWATDHAAEFRA
ncbi:MAG TPA: NAD(P)H-binding protein [Vicinamibacterales bacterium]|nr:NAD(P)H-binding protein [Vicinamibacterales bacterium]